MENCWLAFAMDCGSYAYFSPPGTVLLRTRRRGAGRRRRKTGDEDDQQSHLTIGHPGTATTSVVDPKLLYLCRPGFDVSKSFVSGFVFIPFQDLAKFFFYYLC
jgi:hypothetical protein